MSTACSKEKEVKGRKESKQERETDHDTDRSEKRFGLGNAGHISNGLVDVNKLKLRNEKCIIGVKSGA